MVHLHLHVNFPSPSLGHVACGHSSTYSYTLGTVLRVEFLWKRSVLEDTWFWGTYLVDPEISDMTSFVEKLQCGCTRAKLVILPQFGNTIAYNLDENSSNKCKSNWETKLGGTKHESGPLCRTSQTSFVLECEFIKLN